MKIIFLDIDGVLITWRSHFAYTPKPEDNRFSSGLMVEYDRVVANFLEKLCVVYGIQIVVSSTWRANPKTCIELLEKCHIDRFLHEDWRTIQSGDKRGIQIQEWLDRHNVGINDYLILDDDIDDEMKNFIKCSMWNGLSGEAMNTMIEWARGGKQIIV